MRNMVRNISFVIAAVIVSSTPASAAAIIGNWSGGTRTWNDSAMTTLATTLTTAGHTIEADEVLTAANLANNDLWVIGEPDSAPGAGDLAILSSWVQGGGTLLLFADSGMSGLPWLNTIATALGSSLFWGGSNPVNAALTANSCGGGGTYNITGQTIDTTAGTAVTGGTSLAGDYVRCEALGLGWVYGFADRTDHNVFAPTAGNTNGQLFLNIAGAAAVVPEPSLMWLVALGFGAALRKHRTRARS